MNFYHITDLMDLKIDFKACDSGVIVGGLKNAGISCQIQRNDTNMQRAWYQSNINMVTQEFVEISCAHLSSVDTPFSLFLPSIVSLLFFMWVGPDYDALLVMLP